MKCLALVFVLAILYPTTLCSPTHHLQLESLEHIENIDACAGELGLTTDEARKSYNMPIEPPGSCVMACVWKKLGLMTDGKINKSDIIEIVKPSMPQAHHTMSLSENNFYQCVDEGNAFDDECVIVAEYFKCLIKHLFASNN